MKTYTPRDFIRGGLKEALLAAASGEDVYIVAGKSQWSGAANPRAVHAYGETVANMRFKLIVDEEYTK